MFIQRNKTFSRHYRYKRIHTQPAACLPVVVWLYWQISHTCVYRRTIYDRLSLHRHRSVVLISHFVWLYALVLSLSFQKKKNPLYVMFGGFMMEIWLQSHVDGYKGIISRFHVNPWLDLFYVATCIRWGWGKWGLLNALKCSFYDG